MIYLNSIHNTLVNSAPINYITSISPKTKIIIAVAIVAIGCLVAAFRFAIPYMIAKKKEWNAAAEKFKQIPLWLHKNRKIETAAADRKAQKLVNILTIGKPESGKTTMVKMLMDPTDTSENTLPEVQVFKHSSYHFKVLDASATKETEISEASANILKDKSSKNFGGNAFENVDVVIFTISLSDGIRTEDINLVNFFLSKFPIHTKKLLVCTHAERSDEEDQNKLRDSVADNDQFADKIKDHFGGKEKILFSGAPPNTSIKQPTAGRISATVLSMREKLIEAILEGREQIQEKGFV